MKWKIFVIEFNSISLNKFQEHQRQKHLILNGKYNIENCPKKLIPLHSIVLSKEMDREKNLLLHGSGEQIPGELALHPVFMTNQKTNNIISRKRSKLKTIREKNAERLIKQGNKWEKERILLEEQDRLREIEAKKRREKLLETEQLYTVEINAQGLDVLAIKNRKYTEPEINLKDFLLSEREAAVKKKFSTQNAFKEVQVMIAAKRRMQKLLETDEGIDESRASQLQEASENGKLTPETPEEGYISSNTDKESIDKLKSQSPSPDPPTPKKSAGKQSRPPSGRPSPSPSKSSKVSKTSSKDSDTKSLKKDSSSESKPNSDEKPEKKKELKTLPKQKATASASSDVDNASDLSNIENNKDTSIETTTDVGHAHNPEAAVKNDIEKGNTAKKPNIKLLHYEDPRIIQLKLTDNVKDMYALADDIIIGDLKKK
uniref:CSON010654 protein n=1 Tax=Culicoides sonorensis TaxID=179676 RepID=A0A336M276_CULSO